MPGLASKFHLDLKMGRSPWKTTEFGVPTHQLNTVGDTVFDREGSAGDAYTAVPS